MTEYFYKDLSIVLAAVLLLVSAGMGYQWHMAAHDRDEAKIELKAAQDVSDELRGAIREQNRAVAALASEKAKADAKGDQARAVAAANGRLLDVVLDQVKAVKASTCAEAMPAVNTILKGIR